LADGRPPAHKRRLGRAAGRSSDSPMRDAWLSRGPNWASSHCVLEPFHSREDRPRASRPEPAIRWAGDFRRLSARGSSSMRANRPASVSGAICLGRRKACPRTSAWRPSARRLPRRFHAAGPIRPKGVPSAGERNRLVRPAGSGGVGLLCVAPNTARSRSAPGLQPGGGTSNPRRGTLGPPPPWSWGRRSLLPLDQIRAGL